MLGAALGYRAIPVGVFVEAGGRVVDIRVPFSVHDPDDMSNLAAFALGSSRPPAPPEVRPTPDAERLFASGATLLARGDRVGALRKWRQAVRADPANFVIRKQIWAVEHPDKFYPAIGKVWQAEVLAAETGATPG